VPRGESLAEPTQVRDAILRVLRRLPEGEWLELRALSNWLERTAPAFVREQLDGQARLLLEPTPWEQLEWPLLRFTLLGPLYWLGRVASSSDGQCISLRGGTRERPREPHTWREDGCLSVPIRTRLGSLLEAERYIALEERGRVSTYRLEQSHVAAALGAGGSIQELRELLRRLTQAPLPHGVEHRLRTWEERFGALTLRPVVVLQARSEADLDAAIAEPAVRQLLSDRLGPSVAEVPAAQVAELAAALRASGHLPRVDAALRLGNAPGRAYPGLVDEQVLEFLLVSLLAFERACPEQLSQLEGAPNLRERLETVFPKARLAELRAVARRLAGDLATHPPRPRRSRRRQNVQ
jgi:hypothetical protein